MRYTKPKSEFAIALPCTQPWDAMTGSATKRHCESCQKQVHNFAVMTPRQIDRVIAENEGHLCARITRRTDGSLVTAQEFAGSSFAAKAASLLLGAALSTATAHAQYSSAPSQKAIVSGRFTDAKGVPPSAQGYVVFVVNGQSILETRTGLDGNWKAELAPGTYDVIFKTNIMFGERVNAVQLHAGEQQFSPVHGRFALNHLGAIDGTTGGEQYAMMGEVVITGRCYYRVSYLFKHPIRYFKSLPRAFRSSNNLRRSQS